VLISSVATPKPSRHNPAPGPVIEDEATEEASPVPRRELTPAPGEAEPPGELGSALWVTSDTGSPPENRELSGQGGLGGVANLNCQRSGMTPPLARAPRASGSTTRPGRSHRVPRASSVQFRSEPGDPTPAEPSDWRGVAHVAGHGLNDAGWKGRQRRGARCASG
jgi:hypothetical protein